MQDEAVTVECQPHGDGWRCSVRVGADTGATEHEVLVDRPSLDRLAPDGDPEDLVRRSLRFLLAREPRTSIMRRFELPMIGRFFPEYEDEIVR